jgi:hypothetical protein
MLKPLPDMLLDAQAETLRNLTYECWACGDMECKSDEIDVQYWREPGTGELREEQICQRCMSLGVLEKLR